MSGSAASCASAPHPPRAAVHYAPMRLVEIQIRLTRTRDAASLQTGCRRASQSRRGASHRSPRRTGREAAPAPSPSPVPHTAAPTSTESTDPQAHPAR